MALNPKLSNVAANAEADAVVDLLNDGYLRIYDGTQPANADTAVSTQVLLAEQRFNATAFGAAAAIRLCFTWFGVRRALTPEQNSQAADTFAADSQFVSAGKKLIDTRHDAYRAVNAIRVQHLARFEQAGLDKFEIGLKTVVLAERVGNEALEALVARLLFFLTLELLAESFFEIEFVMHS